MPQMNSTRPRLTYLQVLMGLQDRVREERMTPLPQNDDQKNKLPRAAFEDEDAGSADDDVLNEAADANEASVELMDVPFDPKDYLDTLPDSASPRKQLEAAAFEDEDAGSADIFVDSDEIACDTEAYVDTPQESASSRRRLWAELGRIVKRAPPTKVSKLLYRVMKRPVIKMAKKIVSNAHSLRRWPVRVLRRVVGAKSRLRLEAMNDDNVEFSSLSPEDMSTASVLIDDDTHEFFEYEIKTLMEILRAFSSDDEDDPDTGQLEEYWKENKLFTP